MNHAFIFSNLFPKKHSNFILECYDYLRDVVPFDGENVFVSGGFFPRRFIGSPLRDIDVYVNGDDKYLEEVIEEYRRLDWEVAKTLKKTYDGENENNNRALHYICRKDGEPNIDLIAFHQPKSIQHVEKFDLNIVQLAMSEDYFHFTDIDIFEHLEKKHMSFTGNICMRTFERIVKYTKLGFNMEEDELSMVRNDFIENIQVRYKQKQKKENEEIPF